MRGAPHLRGKSTHDFILEALPELNVVRTVVMIDVFGMVLCDLSLRRVCGGRPRYAAVDCTVFCTLVLSVLSMCGHHSVASGCHV